MLSLALVMNKKEFSEVVILILREDSRFKKGAYFFVRRALDHTLQEIREHTKGHTTNHVSGQELLGGIRDFALRQYGPMTMTLFEQWGLSKCADFGDIVFNLVEHGVFGKTEADCREDFANGYDFREAFFDPFVPKSSKSAFSESRESEEAPER